ncbi:MAG TPA: carboxypeptidase-like regulatory domain-containing protein [Puia sp.]
MLILTLCNHLVNAQMLIKGTVYDRSQFYPMQAVSVMSTSGAGTVTDSSGQYHITLRAGDSLYFSYLGKGSSKFPVNEITDPSQFNISLDVAVDTLQSISVNPKNYGIDSLENRMEYQKIFNYYSPGYVNDMKSNRRGGIGMGFNMDMIFSSKNDKRMLALQQRLEEEEQQNYVDHRFSKAVVKRVTGLQPPALDTFMRQYRPSYQLVKSFATDWEFYEYILNSSKFFLPIWKEEHPD